MSAVKREVQCQFTREPERLINGNTRIAIQRFDAYRNKLQRKKTFFSLVRSLFCVRDTITHNNDKGTPRGNGSVPDSCPQK